MSDANETNDNPNRGSTEKAGELNIDHSEYQRGYEAKDGTVKPSAENESKQDSLEMTDPYPTNKPENNRYRGLSKNQDPASESDSENTRKPETTNQNTNDQAKPTFEPAAPVDNKDPQKPTVAFLDNFTKDWPAVTLNGDDNEAGKISHGEFSASAAEKNGFNALRLELATNGAKDIDFAKTIDDVGKAIDDGKLPLGKGDVLNISAGNNDPTFAEASKTLGFEVNAENLKEMRPKILERLDQLSKDPNQSDKDRERFKRVVDTNAAIDRLQSRGVEVMQSAGNEGPNKFSWDFMNAKHQLSGVKEDGTPEKFSANHSLATPTKANVDIHYQKYDMHSPQPLAQQNGPGTYTIGDHKIPASQLGGERTSKYFVERDKNGDVQRGRPPETPTDVAFNPSAKNAQALMPPHNPQNLEIAKTVKDHVDFTRKSSTLSGGFETKGTHVENAMGTSYANISELPKHLERLRKIKAGN